MVKQQKKESRPCISVKKLEQHADSFDKKMKEVRREYIKKASNSEKSASKVVLTS
jgi:predicted ATP-grasp superfamily ATP-dependent carboligase